MTYSIEFNKPIFSVTLALAQWTPVQSGHGGMNRGYAWPQQHGFPLQKLV